MESIKLVPFCPKTPPPGWKCPKRLKLGVGSPWESSNSEDNSETEMDELLVASRRIRLVQFCQTTPPPGWKCPKRFKLGIGVPWESSDSEDDSETEINELYY